jgi:hypothetical protein
MVLPVEILERVRGCTAMDDGSADSARRLCVSSRVKLHLKRVSYVRI